MRPLQREKASFLARNKVVPREPASFGCRFVFWMIWDGDSLNFTAKMIPGLCFLAGGAVLSFMAARISQSEDGIPKIKLIGVGLAALGAVWVFLS